MRRCVRRVFFRRLTQQGHSGLVIEVVGELEGLAPEGGGIADSSRVRRRGDAGQEQRQDRCRVRPALDHGMYDSSQTGVQLAMPRLHRQLGSYPTGLGTRVSQVRRGNIFDRHS